MNSENHHLRKKYSSWTSGIMTERYSMDSILSPSSLTRGYRPGEVEKRVYFMMSQKLQIRDARTPAGEKLAIVPLQGRLASQNASEIRQLLHQVISYGYANILLDLSAVDFIDSSGIGVLISALKKCRTSGGNLCLCHLSESIVGLLEITSLNQAFSCFDDIQTGISMFPNKSSR
jgi:anti-sigma B factor antagonist